MLIGGVILCIFVLIKDFFIDVIVIGDECIIDDVIVKWMLVWLCYVNFYWWFEKFGV